MEIRGEISVARRNDNNLAAEKYILPPDLGREFCLAGRSLVNYARMEGGYTFPRSSGRNRLQGDFPRRIPSAIITVSLGEDIGDTQIR